MSNGARQKALHIKPSPFFLSHSDVKIYNWAPLADVPMINYKSHSGVGFKTLFMSVNTLA